MAGRRWTEDELQMLEDMISTYPVASIARKLGRSFESVNQKMRRMGISGFRKSTDLLSKNAACLMMGVNHRTVERWIRNGLSTRKKGRFRYIRQEDLLNYLKNHPGDWNALKVTDDSILMSYHWYKEKKKCDTKRRYFWTPEEISTLKTLRHQGYYIREIAQKMDRSESSIKYQLYYGRKTTWIN